MTKVLVYEFMSAGSWHTAWPNTAPPESLMLEGAAMLAAVVADLATVTGVHVSTIVDRPAAQHWLTSSQWHPELNEHPRASSSSLSLTSDLNLKVADRAEGSQSHAACAPKLENCTVHESSPATDRGLFAELAAEADWTLVIAPEIGGHLLDRCRIVEQCGGRLLGPSSECVALCSDKHATAQHLAEHGLPAPRGCIVRAGKPLPDNFDYPAVLKPLDGAGSQGVRVVGRADHAGGPWSQSMRLEAFVPGIPASVAVLCGSGTQVPLTPCRQVLSDDGRFAYLGGELPLEPHLAARAARLAKAAVATLPGALGYLGVDLVLGQSEADDRIIEINPRLTTSYIGLRHACRQNLAAAMLNLAQGRPTTLSYRAEPLQFDAGGGIIIDTCTVSRSAR